MYTTHNKLFDKHPLVREVMMRLTGNSILLAETTPEWKKRRVAVSPAFYKGKLIQMVNIAKESVQVTVERWRKIIGGKPRTRFDFMEEMQLLAARILLTCALGEDVSEDKVNYHHDGKVEQREVSFVLRQTFHDCIFRMASPHVVAFRFLSDCYLMPYERDIKANCESVRNLI
jgi:cytochrome P450